MNHLTILIDMDDTIECLLEAWLNWLNQKHGTNVQYEDVTEWDLWKQFPSLTKEEVYAPLSEAAFWRTVRPMGDAVNILKQLLDDGHDIFIVTASSYKTLEYKMNDVLFKYFPYLSWSNVIITSHKQMICGDVLIDDAPHNLEGGNYMKILMDSPHNKTYNEVAHGMIRVRSWQAVYHLIKMRSYNHKISI